MKTSTNLLSMALLGLLGSSASGSLNNFQGFEINTVDWMVPAGITPVLSGLGTPARPSSSGNYYAEIKNTLDGYQAGYGDAGFSRFGGNDSVYHGAFYQSIDVYINVNWAVPVLSPTERAFWIDMTPYHADAANYGAEHNFQVKALGTMVEVYVDGGAAPIATLTSSGWYTFLMTWRQAPSLANPVITDMNVYDSAHELLGTAQLIATSPGGPFLSSDLRGNGYVWITLWQNGFAGDVLAIDDVRTGVLPRGTKTDVRAALAALIPTANKQAAQKLAEAIKHLDKSLAPGLWIDALRLADKGEKVFNEEKETVRQLREIKNASPAMTMAINSAVVALVGDDQSLAQTAMDDAASGNAGKLAQAQKEMDAAAKDLAKGNEEGAIEHYKHAWHFAQMAL